MCQALARDIVEKTKLAILGNNKQYGLIIR